MTFRQTRSQIFLRYVSAGIYKAARTIKTQSRENRTDSLTAELCVVVSGLAGEVGNDEGSEDIGCCAVVWSILWMQSRIVDSSRLDMSVRKEISDF